jgi:hypothetical protein
MVRRLEREAAARAAVIRFALFVLSVGRFRATRDFCVDFLRVAPFAPLVDLRFATLASVLENRESLIMDRRIPDR